MGLAIAVGPLAGYLANGEQEGAEWFQRDLAEINRVLAAHGFPAHAEPQVIPNMRDRCRLSGMPYSWIHYLRRAYAYARHAPDRLVPLEDDKRATEDPILDREQSHLRSHLCCHSDCEGYYVPVNFPEPLFDDTDALVGAMLGSSQAAMRELVFVAPFIGVPLPHGELLDETAEVINCEEGHPFYIERQVWLQLFESFRLSIEHGAAVKFC